MKSKKVVKKVKKPSKLLKGKLTKEELGEFKTISMQQSGIKTLVDKVLELTHDTAVEQDRLMTRLAKKHGFKKGHMFTINFEKTTITQGGTDEIKSSKMCSFN